MLEQRCGGVHSHLRIEGRYTKNSAVYTPALARHFALAFGEALRRRTLEEEDGDRRFRGESVVVNDLLLTGGWRVKREWFWKRS